MSSFPLPCDSSPSWGSWSVRPVTLHRHLSMVCAFKLSWRVRGSTDQIRSVIKTPGYSPASGRRQEIDRVHDGHCLNAILRAKIDCLDAVHYLSNEIRRIHVSRLQLAHRHGSVRLDRQAQHHLALQGRIAAQGPVVIPVESRFVTIENNLYFFVGAGSSQSAARFGSVGATADRCNRAGRADHLHARHSAVAPTTTASASTTSQVMAHGSRVNTAT